MKDKRGESQMRDSISKLETPQIICPFLIGPFLIGYLFLVYLKFNYIIDFFL